MFEDILHTIEASTKALSDIEKEALDAVFQARPQLIPFIEKYGQTILKDYGVHVIDKTHSISETLKTILYQRIKRFFGDSAARLHLEKSSATSSIDTSGHGGIFSEDTLVQSHGVIAQGFQDAKSPSFVSLACGVVPMNNATWPRGFFVLGARESIFPKSFDRVAFHECTAFTPDMIEKKLADKTVAARSRALFEFIKEIPNIFEQKMYFEQTSLINHLLWERFMVTEGQTPSFYQFMLEDVTSELVIDAINKDDALCNLIFCREKQHLFFEMLSNLPGTWSTDRSKGTYLFWHAGGDFRASALWLDDDKLSNDRFETAFTRESIKGALQKREIVPSVFLSLITILHNGIRPLGGYHQLSYLPEYRKRIIDFINIEKNLSCPDFLGHIQCINLFHLGYGFSFLKDPEHHNILAGIDTFMKFPESKKAFTDMMHSTTVASALVSNVQRLYNEIVPASARTIKF